MSEARRPLTAEDGRGQRNQRLNEATARLAAVIAAIESGHLKPEGEGLDRLEAATGEIEAILKELR